MRKYVAQVYQAFFTLVPLLEYTTAETFAQGMGTRVLDLDWTTNNHSDIAEVEMKTHREKYRHFIGGSPRIGY